MIFFQTLVSNANHCLIFHVSPTISAPIRMNVQWNVQTVTFTVMEHRIHYNLLPLLMITVHRRMLPAQQLVHTTERSGRPTDNRFLKESRGGLTITNAMLEDDGKWQCEAENSKGYIENGRPIQLVVLGRYMQSIITSSIQSY